MSVFSSLWQMEGSHLTLFCKKGWQDLSGLGEDALR